MSSDFMTLQEFNENLVRLVTEGDYRVHVLDYRRWSSLPENLRARYYPLQNRMDTSYRMYPQFMSRRVDKIPHGARVTGAPKAVIEEKKIVTVPLQQAGDDTVTLPHVPLATVDPKSSGTEASKKSFTRILRESVRLMKNPVYVTTKV